MQISGIKTVEDAIAAVEAIAIPQPVPLPKEPAPDATPAALKAYEAGLATANSANAFTALQGGLIETAKAMTLARLKAQPAGVKVLGLELRADVAQGMETVSLRIIHHS